MSESNPNSRNPSGFNSLLPPSKEVATSEFRTSFREGRLCAFHILPKLLDHEITLDQLDEKLKPLPENVRHVTELLLFSTEMIKLARFHAIEGEGKKDRQLNYDHILRFNRALRDIILDADETTITIENLVNGISGFARRYNLISQIEETSYCTELKTAMVGVWHEQSTVNLLCAAGIGNYDATVSEDKEGRDIMVALDKEKTRWVGIDVKSSVYGMNRYLDKFGFI
jgi:hypothetical protein